MGELTIKTIAFMLMYLTCHEVVNSWRYLEKTQNARVIFGLLATPDDRFFLHRSRDCFVSVDISLNGLNVSWVMERKEHIMTASYY